MKEFIVSAAMHMRRRLFHGAVLSAVLVIAMSSIQLTGCSTLSEKQALEPVAVTEPAPPADDWGIKVTSVRLTAHNYMVDFRYRVLDAKKAEALFSKKTRPYLIHEKTGKVLAVPRTAKVGPLMSSYHPKQDRIYWMFFGNQTHLVNAGDEVSVVIGDFKAVNLIVE